VQGRRGITEEAKEKGIERGKRRERGINRVIMYEWVKEQTILIYSFGFRQNQFVRKEKKKAFGDPRLLFGF
jgi:hypothetical protein